MDGVGYLLYALLELDQVLKNPKAVATNTTIAVGNGQTTMNLDNW